MGVPCLVQLSHCIASFGSYLHIISSQLFHFTTWHLMDLQMSKFVHYSLQLCKILFCWKFYQGVKKLLDLMLPGHPGQELLNLLGMGNLSYRYDYSTRWHTCRYYVEHMVGSRHIYKSSVLIHTQCIRSFEGSTMPYQLRHFFVTYSVLANPTSIVHSHKIAIGMKFQGPKPSPM